jgi:LmbE family N-acetylglucosaminyl deacetylase
MHNFNRILTLSPHTDDVELSNGGTIAKWIEEGNQVFSAVFSIAEDSVPEGLPKNILEKECIQATRTLGVLEKNLFIYKFTVRDFPKFRQEILDILIKLREQLKPDLVLLPSLNDVHQDHRTIAEEGVRAFKNFSILGYEQPWNLRNFTPQLFVTLDERHLEKKMQAINCYKSQQHRKYTNEKFIYGLAQVRGVQINRDYAEAFEVIRWII